MLLNRSPWIAILLATVVCSSVHAAEPETADQLLAKGVELRKKGDRRGRVARVPGRAREGPVRPHSRADGDRGGAPSTVGWTPRTISRKPSSRRCRGSRRTAPTLEQTLQTVRTHTTEISIYGTTGAVVTLEDKVVGRIPLPTVPRVNEGNVTVKVESRGYKPFVQTLPAKGGSQLIVTATLEPLPPEPAPPASVPDAAAGDGHAVRWRRRLDDASGPPLGRHRPAHGRSCRGHLGDRLDRRGRKQQLERLQPGLEHPNARVVHPGRGRRRIDRRGLSPLFEPSRRSAGSGFPGGLDGALLSPARGARVRRSVTRQRGTPSAAPPRSHGVERDGQARGTSKIAPANVSRSARRACAWPPGSPGRPDVARPLLPARPGARIPGGRPLRNGSG